MSTPDARREAGEAYVNLPRFQYRMWSEKDGMRNHFNHGWDAHAETVPELVDMWGVGRKFGDTLSMDWKGTDREHAERMLVTFRGDPNHTEEESEHFWNLYHWVESKPVVIEPTAIVLAREEEERLVAETAVLDAMPIGAFIRDRHGDAAQKTPLGWRYLWGVKVRSSKDMVYSFGPLEEVK